MFVSIPPVVGCTAWETCYIPAREGPLVSVDVADTRGRPHLLILVNRSRLAGDWSPRQTYKASLAVSIPLHPPYRHTLSSITNSPV